MRIAQLRTADVRRITWPCSATPDYIGVRGFLVVDGDIPYFVSETGNIIGLSDALAEAADPMWKAAVADQPKTSWAPKFPSGIGIYGHLIAGQFVSRFIEDLDVITGRKPCRYDISSGRATLMRILVAQHLAAADYEGQFWLAPSRSVLNELDYAKWCSRWSGEPFEQSDLPGNHLLPPFQSRGALLTDVFVGYSPASESFWKPSAAFLENADL